MIRQTGKPVFFTAEDELVKEGYVEEQIMKRLFQAFGRLCSAAGLHAVRVAVAVLRLRAAVSDVP